MRALQEYWRRGERTVRREAGVTRKQHRYAAIIATRYQEST